MKLDENKIDNSALALLHLTLHDEFRAWKQIDFDVMNRLYQKGYILTPANKSKSIQFTDKGLEEAEKLFSELFE